MKTLLLTSINNDNKWLDEWLRHHLKFGFSNIVIYDSNTGMNDYPLTDYAILMCTSKRIKVINYRDKILNSQDELNNKEYSNYDFVIWLSMDEYIASKEFNKIENALENATSSLSLRTYPFSINNGKKKLMLDKYFSFKNKTLKNNSNDNIENTNKLYVEKFPNRNIDDWKKYILSKNERS